MKLHASGEDYLEAILVLHKKMGMVRSVDVARQPGGHKAQRLQCGGDPAGRGLPDNGQRLFPAPDRCGAGSGGADL